MPKRCEVVIQSNDGPTRYFNTFYHVVLSLVLGTSFYCQCTIKSCKTTFFWGRNGASNEIERNEVQLYNIIDDTDEAGDSGGKTEDVKLPSTKEFSLKKCPAYMPTTIPSSGDREGVADDNNGIYETVSSI